MKKIYALALAVLVGCVFVKAQTYYWVGTTTGSWNSSSSWNTNLNGSGSSRTSPQTTDVLIFDGSNVGGASPATGAVTVNNVAAETIAQLKFQNAASITFATSAATTATGTIARTSQAVTGTGTSFASLFQVGDFLYTSATANYLITAVTDNNNLTTFESGTIAASTAFTKAATIRITGNPGLTIASGCTLNINTTVPCNIYLVTGATGTVAGNFSVAPASGTATRIVAADAQALQFNSGAVFTSNGGTSSGSVFGTNSAVTNDNIVFNSGSTLVFKSGSNPFGATAPASVLKLNSGSLYSQQTSTAPSVSGRTYGNFEYNASTGTLALSSTNAFTMDDFTMTAGTLTFGSAASGSTASNYIIKGNLIVNGGTFTIGQGTGSGTAATNITFSGSGKSLTVNSGTFTLNNVGTYTTNLIIGNGANFTTNQSLNLTTSNTVINLIVQPTAVFKIGTGATVTTNSRLTIQSDATGTGTIGNSAGTLSGSVTLQHYVPGNLAWRTVGFPFTNSTNITGAAGNTSLNAFVTTPARAYWYNEAADDQSNYGSSGSVNAGWNSYTAGTSKSATNGILLWGTSSPSTISMTGAINSGDQFVSITKSKNGWNLIANPYASNINWTSIAGNNGGALASTTVYRVNPLGNGAYSFSSYVAGSGSGTNGGSSVLENGASFFIQAASASTLTISETDKTTNAPSVVTGGISLMGIEKNILSISLKGSNGFSDDVIMRWGIYSDATDGFDAKRDAYDLGTYKTHDLSVVGNDGIRYSVFHGAALATPDKEYRTIKLGLQSLEVGHYDFEMNAGNGFDYNNKVFLIDNFLHTSTEIKNTASIGFDVTSDASSKADGRFSIAFNYSKLQTALLDNTAEDIRIIGNPVKENKVTVAFNNDFNKLDWQMVDAAGKLINMGNFVNVTKGSTKQINTPVLPNGVYYIQFKSSTTVKNLSVIKE